jgi:hypothetical protein
VTIPFEIIELEQQSSHSIIKAFYKGSIFNLIIDTGASRSVLDKYFTDTDIIKLNIEPPKSSHSVNSEIFEFGSVIIPELKVGKKIVKNILFTLIDIDYINKIYSEHGSIKITGLLGNDFFLERKAIIDYSKKSITLQEDNKL